MKNWRDIPGYEGYYQINTSGEIKSLDREVKNGDKSKRIIASKIIKQTIKPNKYLSVMLSKECENKRFLVHRLVALTFLGESDLCVNHIDGNKQNNNIKNLEYCTYSENNNHGFNIGINKNFGGNHYSTKLTTDIVLKISKEKGTHADIARKYDSKYTTVKQIRNGKNWSRVTGIKYERKNSGMDASIYRDR